MLKLNHKIGNLNINGSTIFFSNRLPWKKLTPTVNSEATCTGATGARCPSGRPNVVVVLFNSPCSRRGRYKLNGLSRALTNPPTPRGQSGNRRSYLAPAEPCERDRRRETDRREKNGGVKAVE